MKEKKRNKTQNLERLIHKHHTTITRNQKTHNHTGYSTLDSEENVRNQKITP